MWLPWWRNTWLSLLFLLGKFCRALWPRNFTSEAKLNLTKLGKYTANITSLHWGSKNLKNIRPDGLEKIIASLMMDNFKKKEEKNTLENPESQPKIVRKKTYNCISSDGNVCKKKFTSLSSKLKRSWPKRYHKSWPSSKSKCDRHWHWHFASKCKSKR